MAKNDENREKSGFWVTGWCELKLDTGFRLIRGIFLSACNTFMGSKTNRFDARADFSIFGRHFEKVKCGHISRMRRSF